MTAELIQLRDFRRKEEQEAAMVRLAKEVMGLIDTSPCEMPPVSPNFSFAAAQQQAGVPLEAIEKDPA